MVSQLLFGETFEILSQEKKWLRIHTHADDYNGWIDEKQMMPLDSAQFKATQHSSFCLGDLTAPAFGKNGSLLLVIGSSLPCYDNNHFVIGEEKFQTDGDV